MKRAPDICKRQCKPMGTAILAEHNIAELIKCVGKWILTIRMLFAFGSTSDRGNQTTENVEAFSKEWVEQEVNLLCEKLGEEKYGQNRTMWKSQIGWKLAEPRRGQKTRVSWAVFNEPQHIIWAVTGLVDKAVDWGKILWHKKMSRRIDQWCWEISYQ